MSSRQGGMKRKRVPVKENLPVKEKKQKCDEEIATANTSDERLPLSELSRIHINETVESKIFSVFSRCKKSCPIPSTQDIDGNLLWTFYLKKDAECSEIRTCYMLTTSPSILPRMRSVLLEWLIEVCHVVHGTLLNVQKIYRGKAASFAKSKLEEADHWLKKNKFDRALESANLAVIRAPISTKGQTLSYDDASILSNSLFIRSEILFKKSEFQLCLNDIWLGLKHHFSDEHKAAVYLRMGKCYLKLSDKKKAEVSFHVACSCGNQKIKDECEKIKQNLENCVGSAHEESKCSEMLTESAEGLLGINKSLMLTCDEKLGRYFKASASIAVGDIVACEEPYVSALRFDKHGSHCLHCFKRLKSPIPCPDCSGVAFCSNLCLNEGIKYHKWECHYIELAIGSGMSLLSLCSWRIVTQQSLDYFKFADSKPTPYKKVLSLAQHSDKRDPKDFLHRTLMALFLLQLLRHSGYFKGQINKVVKNGSCSSDVDRIDLNEDEFKVATLILKNLQVLQYNAHEIYETVFQENNISGPGVTCYVGLGLYLQSSLFNHECQPTLARYFSDKKIILRAQRPININMPVSENYGPIFTMKTKDERQKLLKGRYLFDCACDACEGNWPKLEEMVTETSLFKCRMKSCIGILKEFGTCDSCGFSDSIDETKTIFQLYQYEWERAASIMTSGKFKEAESDIIHYVNGMCKLVSQPSKNLCLAMEALRTIWAKSCGNISIVPFSIKRPCNKSLQ